MHLVGAGACRAVAAVEVMHLGVQVSLRFVGAAVVEAMAVRRQTAGLGFVKTVASVPSTQ